MFLLYMINNSIQYAIATTMQYAKDKCIPYNTSQVNNCNAIQLSSYINMSVSLTSMLRFVLRSRCKKWVENCCRSDLRNKTPDHLNKYHRLCARHFEPNLITKTVSYHYIGMKVVYQHL